MKKTLLAISAVTVLVLLAVGALFTPFGNGLIKPIIESKLNEKLPKKITLEKFRFSPSSFDIKLVLEPGSFIEANGDFSIFSRSVDAKYLVDIKDLAVIAPLIDFKIRGPFKSYGDIKGDEESMSIDGKIQLAEGGGDYDVELKNFEPKTLRVDIDSLKLQKLLYMLYQPEFVGGALDIVADLKNLDPKNLSGKATVTMVADVNREIMKRDFNITLPKTDIKGDINADLKGSEIEYDALVASNLAKISSKGTIESENLNMDLDYSIKISELALLKPVTNAPLRGSFATSGKVSGNRDRLVVLGRSDVAKSDTKYELVLREFSPVMAKASVSGAKLADLLYMVEQPKYADALIDMELKMDSLAFDNLSGVIETKIKQGRTFPAVLKREFNLTDADIKFVAEHHTKIEKSVATTKAQIDSTVAKAEVQKAIFDIKANSLVSDYKVDVPDLDRLYFATQKHLKGSVTVTGDIKKDKDLIITGHSDTLGGKIDFKIVNDEVTNRIRGIKVTALTDMLIYPRVFDSSMDADVSYNLATKKGRLDATLLKGRILPNQMTFLLSQMAKFDITKEIYEETKITSKIDDKRFVSDLDMKSRLTRITSKGAVLDMNRNSVEAKLQIDIKGKPVYVKIRGDIDSPKVSLDAGSILKKRLEQKLENKIPQQYKEPLKNLLKAF